MNPYLGNLPYSVSFPARGSFDNHFLPKAGSMIRSRFYVLVVVLAACSDAPLVPDHKNGPPQNSVGATKSVIVGFHARPSAADLALIQSVGGVVTRQFK